MSGHTAGRLQAAAGRTAATRRRQPALRRCRPSQPLSWSRPKQCGALCAERRKGPAVRDPCKGGTGRQAAGGSAPGEAAAPSERFFHGTATANGAGTGPAGRERQAELSRTAWPVLMIWAGPALPQVDALPTDQATRSNHCALAPTASVLSCLLLWPLAPLSRPPRRPAAQPSSGAVSWRPPTGMAPASSVRSLGHRRSGGGGSSPACGSGGVISALPRGLRHAASASPTLLRP